MAQSQGAQWKMGDLWVLSF